VVAPNNSVIYPTIHFADISHLVDERIALLASSISHETAVQETLGAGFDHLCRRLDGFWGQAVGNV
jgi:hypothetical protein